MKRILFIQNGEYDRAGLFGAVMADLGYHVDEVHAWRGEPTPTEPDAWSGIGIGGGAMGVYQQEEFPFLTDEIRLIQAAIAKGTSVLGLCLGAQLLAAAGGGRVYKHDRKEIGMFEVRLNAAAAEDRLWCGAPASFRPVHWHGDTFTLPQGATLLGSSEITPHQLFRFRDLHYGLQFHLEIDEPLLREMVETDEALLPIHGVDPRGFLAAAEKALPTVTPIAREVFRRWGEALP